MRTGDVLITRSLRIMIGLGWLDYKAPKREQFVVLLLGSEDIKAEGQKLDPAIALRDLGWRPISSKKETSIQLSPLQIKPLVWEPVAAGECLEGTGDYYLCHQAGQYWIHRKASGDLRGSDGKVAFYDDRVEAKAAAQTDHETRIRSALEDPK